MRLIGCFVLYEHAPVRPIAFHDSGASLRSRSRRACKYRVNSTGLGQSLSLKRGEERRPGPSTYIFVWGELVVYTSPNEVKGTLEADEVDEQYVRLIQVADNVQLRLMLEAGVELCGGDAALYVRVDPTCPVYLLGAVGQPQVQSEP